MKVNTQILVVFICTILLYNTSYSMKRKIKTAKCRYTFVVNEMDMSNCPNALSQLQADRDPEKTRHINRLLENNLPINVQHKVAEGERSDEVRRWLNNMEKQLNDEMQKSNEINSTLSKHETLLNNAEKILLTYETNLTAIFRMLRYLEKSIQDQDEVSRHLDKKLSGVMLDVVEVNNVLSKKVTTTDGGQLQGKVIEVQAVSKVTSCSVSPEVVNHRDCADVQRRHNTSGVYYVTPTFASCPIPVWCDMDSPLGGWLVLLRRQNGHLSFNRLWNEYKNGFGNIVTEYYLGNDNIFLLTNQKHYELRVDLWDFEGNRVYALYKIFKIDGERDNYQLHVHSFEGSARDALIKHDRTQFSTPDRDNDGYAGYNCGKEWEAGWWFNNCWFGFLTGPYYNISKVRYRGISWNEWKHEQLARAEMKIRPSRLTPIDPELKQRDAAP